MFEWHNHGFVVVARWNWARATWYSTHSVHRTKATLIYRRTGNLGAVQILLGHTKIERTVRYLGIEVAVLWPFRNRSKSDTSGGARLLYLSGSPCRFSGRFRGITEVEPTWQNRRE